MKKYIKNYRPPFEDRLNKSLMNKEGDEPLVEFVKDTFKSLEVLKNIKILGFEYNKRESTIDINKYIFKRNKKKKKKDRHPIKYVADTRNNLLTAIVHILVEEEDPKTKEKILREKTVKKDILIPFQDEDGYYYIKGRKYYIIYQLVDKSTYNSTATVTLKSLMPIAVKRTKYESNDLNIAWEKTKRGKVEVKDSKGNKYVLPVYSVFVFRKEIPIILFYMANGLEWAMNYLYADNIIHFKSSLEDADIEKNLYFQISSKCYIEVNREVFIAHKYIQSIVGALLHVTTNRITIENLYDKEIWIKKLSKNNTLDKGLDTLVFFNRLMDETTKKVLKLSRFNKKDVYSILRWIMMEYTELRMKDNLCLDNKRLRANEYIASLLTREFSKRLNRLISLGKRATLIEYLDVLRFGGDIIIQHMHKSGILRFEDTVNDMTFFSRFRYTTKGPNSLGGKNSNNISIRYRGIHPSYLGKIDLLTCGNSDPGTSGILTPFSTVEGLYFDHSNEPDDELYNLRNDIFKVYDKDSDTEYITINAPTKEAYYDALNKISDMNENAIEITKSKSKDAIRIIVEDPDVDQKIGSRRNKTKEG